MSALHHHLEDYLRLRRSLGFKLEFPGLVLPSLVTYLEAAGAAAITAELAVAWAGLPRGVLPITWAHRLGAARGFARYLKAIDPATEIPPAGIWPSVSPRPRPWIWAETYNRHGQGAGLKPHGTISWAVNTKKRLKWVRLDVTSHGDQGERWEQRLTVEAQPEIEDTVA